MLAIGKRLAEGEVCLVDRRAHVGPPAGGQCLDVAQDPGLVGQAMDRAEPLGRFVEGEHANLIFRTEHFHGPAHRLFGQLDRAAGFHRLGAIHHENQGHAGPLGLSGGRGNDRQGVLRGVLYSPLG